MSDKLEVIKQMQLLFFGGGMALGIIGFLIWVILFLCGLVKAPKWN